jgi:hypothetical protein
MTVWIFFMMLPITNAEASLIEGHWTSSTGDIELGTWCVNLSYTNSSIYPSLITGTIDSPTGQYHSEGTVYSYSNAGNPYPNNGLLYYPMISEYRDATSTFTFLDGLSYTVPGTATNEFIVAYDSTSCYGYISVDETTYGTYVDNGKTFLLTGHFTGLQTSYISDGFTLTQSKGIINFAELTVTEIPSVPIPSSAWLFSFGLIVVFRLKKYISPKGI